MERELVDALLGTEYRDPFTVQRLSRLSWLRTLLTSCKQPQAAQFLTGGDDRAFAEMLDELEAMLRDLQVILIRSGYLPGPLM
jgi:UDP-N-acetyl-D-mannosaminuronic acid transferase (WecB/TagA/CpsF family)